MNVLQRLVISEDTRARREFQNVLARLDFYTGVGDDYWIVAGSLGGFPVVVHENSDRTINASLSGLPLSAFASVVNGVEEWVRQAKTREDAKWHATP